MEPRHEYGRLKNVLWQVDFKDTPFLKFMRHNYVVLQLFVGEHTHVLDIVQTLQLQGLL